MRVFTQELADCEISLIKPARQGEPAREDARFLKPSRQCIESVFDRLKGRLGLEQHGGRTPGVCDRAGAPATPRTQCPDLAQPCHRATSTQVIDRLRPLNPWNQPSWRAAVMS